MATGSSAPTSDGEQPWNSETASKFESKQFSEYYDPCQEAATRSLRCLHRNGGDRAMCGDYFQAYRDCKKQWITARSEAKMEAKRKAREANSAAS